MSQERTRVLVYTPIASDTEAVAQALRSAHPETQVDTATTEAEAAPLIGEAEVLMAWKFPAELLRGAGKLRWIQKLGTGVDDLRQAPVPDGVVVTNTRQVFGPWVAEYCLTYMLAVAKLVRHGLELQAQHNWDPYDPSMLRDKVLGVAGLGNIGRETARLARAFRMTVYGLRRRPGGPEENFDHIYGPQEKLRFLRDLDYLVLALPSTEETAAFMDREAFAAVKPGLTVINVGRGTAIVEDELVGAVQRGQVTNAALDVFATEPLPADNPLWDLPGVWVTPHIAGPVYVDELPVVAVEQLDRYLRGEPVINAVDLNQGY